MQAPLSRRRFLRLLGGAAGSTAGLGMIACGSRTAAHGGQPPVHAAAGAPPKVPTTPLAQPTADLPGGVEQVFWSRPDLRPPAVEVTVAPGRVADGMIFTEGHAGPAQQGPMIIDSAGKLVWFKPLSEAGSKLRAFNFRVQRYRGRPVLTWFQGRIVGAHGVGHYEIYDDRYRPLAQVHGGNGHHGDLHDFVLTDRDTALFTCYGYARGSIPRGRRRGPGSYWYGVVQEVHVPSGKVLFEWRSDHHVPLEASFHPAPDDPSIAWDYFHINSIAIDPSDGNLLISGRNTWAIYKIHRRTGRVMWTLGGKHSDFALGRNAHFAFQHHVVAHPDRKLTIFDNESGPPPQANQSRGLVLAIEERRRRARFVREYVHSPSVLSNALGSVQHLSNGHTFVGWGDAGYFTEYDAAGQVAFDARLAAGTLSYRAFKQPWSGRPDADPDLAVTRSGTTAILSASWNGATEVTHWRVLGGASPDLVREITTLPRSGFETGITIENAPQALAVEALDRSGRRLARSTSVTA